MSALLSPHGGDRGIESAWMKREGRERGMERDRGREKEKEKQTGRETDRDLRVKLKQNTVSLWQQPKTHLECEAMSVLN